MGRRFIYTSNHIIYSIVSAVYGFTFGGIAASAVNIANKTVYSTRTTSANSSSNLTTARATCASLSNKSTYGYISKDATSGDRIVFSTEVTSSHTNSKISTDNHKNSVVGISDGSNYGYFCGGVSTSSVRSSIVDRITFSTEVTSANSSNLSQARSDTASVSDGSNYGYIQGGYASGEQVTSDRITFSSSVVAVNTSTKLSQKRTGTALSNNSTYGYVTGGWSGSANLSLTERITFSSGTISNYTTSNLTTAKRLCYSSYSDGSSYGYVAGGYTTTTTSQNDVITFSTETFAILASAALSQAVYGGMSLSDFSV